MACNKITKSLCGTKRGQIAIEFIFLMLIIFTLIATIVAPASSVAVDSVKEVGGTAQCKLNASMIANAVDSINIAGDGAKQTLYLQLPPNCSIDTSAGDEISFKYIQGSATNEGTINLKTTISSISSCENTTSIPSSITATIETTGVTCA